MVIFCRRHIGIPQERSAGEWLHSVTTPTNCCRCWGVFSMLRSPVRKIARR
ncbi:hypothetical protein LNO89_25730 [Klebsiella pneumoniae subsp. pneumoniae]|nr:hypothetical protein [Klebsiella pneumoniae subsp. pneumoniae]